MKKLYTLFVACLIAATGLGQDIIYRSETDSICAKIITVDKSKITYKLAGYDDGPLFTLEIDEITAIRYANGIYQSYASMSLKQNSGQEMETPVRSQKKSSACFIGGTGEIGYSTAFTFAAEPIIGYEFNDWIAIGTGIGVIVSIPSLGKASYYKAPARNVTAASSSDLVMGILEPFLRVCAWHNEIVFIDFKATTAIAFNRTSHIWQIGVRPSLRVRLSEHCDMAADIGLFGAQYTSGYGWTPALGIGATSAGLWFAYRF